MANIHTKLYLHKSTHKIRLGKNEQTKASRLHLKSALAYPDLLIIWAVESDLVWNVVFGACVACLRRVTLRKRKEGPVFWRFMLTLPAQIVLTLPPIKTDR